MGKNTVEYQRAYNLRYYHDRRKYLIGLLGGKCVECGSKYRLEFDHIDPKKKKFTIGSRMSYALKDILREIKKCQLLCRHCHEKKSEDDNGKALHGTYSMYRHHECRCRPCMDAYNVARKRWR